MLLTKPLKMRTFLQPLVQHNTKGLFSKRGSSEHAAKRTVDEEELAVVHGSAREQKMLFEQGIQENAPRKKTIDEEDLSYSRGSTKEQKMLFERGVQEHTTKKTIDEEELSYSRGAAREQKKLFEQGVPEHETKKTLDEEELAYARGNAQEQRRLFEEGGAFEQAHKKKTIDDEELAAARGTAQEQRRMFEEGHLESKPKKYIEEEEFPGSMTAQRLAAEKNGEEFRYVQSDAKPGEIPVRSFQDGTEESPGKKSMDEELSQVRGATREQRRLFERGNFEQGATKKTIDDEDMSFAHGKTALEQKRLIEQGHYESKVKKYLDEEEFPDTMTGRMVEVEQDDEPARYVSSDARPGEIPSKFTSVNGTEESHDQDGSMSISVTSTQITTDNE